MPASSVRARRLVPGIGLVPTIILISGWFLSSSGLAQAQVPTAAPSPGGPQAQSTAEPAGQPFSLRLEPALQERNAEISEGRPVFAAGNKVSGRADRETTVEGEAEVRRAGTVVRADRITYYVVDDEVVAVGQVRIAREGNVFTGPQLQLKVDASEGFMLSPRYSISLNNAQGSADRVDFLGPERVVLHNGTYSTCSATDPDWYLRADSLLIDQTSQEGSGSGGDLVFLGRTILKAPIFSFPLGDQRRSGLLAPTLSLVSKTGGEVLIPYYFNIAPNRDFTLYNRLMALRGLQVGGLARYLEPNYSGETRFEYNPMDLKANVTRYQYASLHSVSNLYGWHGSWNIKGVSDDNYFVDYARTIISSSERSLPRDINAVRVDGDWTFNVRATRYQNILEARAAPPYERLPQLAAAHNKQDFGGGFDLLTAFDATRFRRPLVESPEGTRIVVNPVLSYPIVRPGWFVTPKLGVHWSSYQLDNNAGQSTSIHRSVPTFSINSGLIFERPATFFGRESIQTLEPRLFYVRTPYRDQTAIPVFDTATADFNFAQIFSENTFIGNDRIADANQVTAAAVSRFIDPQSGREAMRMAIGQRYYFSDQRVNIPNVPNRTDSRSDILLAAGFDLGDGRSFDAGLQYAVADGGLPRGNIAYRQATRSGRIFNVGIRYLRSELGQLDTSWRQPVSRRWTTLGRVNYSFLNKRIDPATGTLVDSKPGIIEGLLGFEYRQDCWAFRFVFQRFITAAATPTSALFFQLDLNGLGRLGSNPFDILRRNIPGYRLPTDRPVPGSRFTDYE